MQTETSHLWRALVAFALAALVVGLAACGGRTGAEGLGLGLGEAGDGCRRSVDCAPGLGCVAGACVPVGFLTEADAADAGRDAAPDAPADIRPGADAPGDTPDNRPDQARPDAEPGCPALAGTLPVPGTVSGSTANRANDGGGTCGGGGAPEAVWALDLTAPTSLSLRTQDAPFDTVLYVRDGCDGQELACNDDDPGQPGTSSRVVLFPEAGRYYVFVDGFGAGQGDYTLVVELVQ